MLFYDMDVGFAPNPRRALIYLVEKGLRLPRQIVNAASGAHKAETYLSVNPIGKLPALVTDTGQAITDSGAIVEFLEELHPEPNMLGTTPLERALVRSFERTATDFLWLTAGVLRNSHPYFEAWGTPKNPGAVDYAMPRFQHLAEALDDLLAAREFAVLDRVTIADCTLCAAYDFAFSFGEIAPHRPLRRLDAWYERFSRRPSARANFETFETCFTEGAP